MTVNTALLGEEVGEQVVEEGQIVMQQVDLASPGLEGMVEGQVIMMTNTEGEQQHVVITSAGITPLTNGSGSQVQAGVSIVDQQSYMLESASLKSEPEDLSFRQSIDLEAGAQAIQASAANAVQNVLRSLKESDKTQTILNQILPGHLAPEPPQPVPAELMVTEDPVRPDSGIGDTPSSEPSSAHTPARRNRSGQDNSPRVQIAKQYSPFGYHCTLEAPTAQWVRKDEDRCTYLNKGQFYGLTLEYRHNQSEPFQGDMKQVKSVVMLVFRDAKNPEEETNAWDFWHQRQPTSKQRIIDAETNNMTDQCGISQIEDVAYNAIAVYWSPLQKPALISCAIQCLSTDFSLQKGVKGLALHLQVDTYCRGPGDSEYEHLVHRAYCQVKVFCDKGAERKFRQEERRAARKVAVGGQRVLDMYHQVGSYGEDNADLFLTTDGLYFSAKKGLIFTPWLTLVKCLCCTLLDQVTNRNPRSLVRHYLLFTVTILLVCSTAGLQQPAIAGGSPAGVSGGGTGSVSILKSNNSSSSVTGAEVRGRKVRLVSDV